MTLLRFFVSTFRRSMLAGLLISILSGIANTLLLTLITRTLGTSDNTPFPDLPLFAGLFVCAVFFDWLAKWLLIRVTSRTTNALRFYLVQQIVQLPYEKIEVIGAARLQTILTEEIQAIGLVVGNLPNMLIALATSAGCLFYLGWLSPITLFMLVVVAIPAAVGYRLLHRRAISMTKKSMAARYQIFHHYRSLIDGIKEIILHRRRQSVFLEQLISPAIEELIEHGVASRSWHLASQSWSQSIYFLFIFVVFAFASIQKIDLGLVTIYAIVVLYLRSAVLMILQSAAYWGDAEITIQLIQHLGFSTDLTLQIPLVADHTQYPKQVDLRIKNLRYQYLSDDESVGFLLGPIDLEFHSGELIFMVGGNGSGKTTLIKLLCGLYRPQHGEIVWNGRAVSEENVEEYRQNFSVIFADFFLFDQLLGIEEWQIDERAGHYLAQLQLVNKVEINGNRLSTTKLSYGQRKRLALLTAYLEDRPVYIFDEWAASQDPEFREVFYRQLLPELKQRGKLVIVISHDDHYFDVADRVIKLDFGKIIEE